MKKIISFALTLALLVSIFAVLPVFAADTSLVGTDVTLTEGISLNFYIKADSTQSITNATPVTKNGVKCYMQTVNLGAKNMGDVLEAQLKSGSVSVGEAYTSSVKSYADRILALTYDKATIGIVSAMLGYGAAAQNYFGYKTNALVGTPVTDISDLAAAVAPEASVADFSGIYIGASLVLEGDMLLRFYFRGNGLTATTDDGLLTSTDKAGYCYFDVAVMPNEISSPVTVSCDGATVTYSALNYLKSKMHDESLSEMVASIYAYGIAAEEYVRVSGCSHDGVQLGTIQMPTVFNGGLNEGVCPTCGGTVTEAVGKTEADVKKYNPSSLSTSDSNNRGSFSSAVNIVDDVLAGGKHFYPDEENGGKGRDLYVEFSFLYNETLKNNNKGYIDIFRIEDENGQGSTPNKFSNYQAHTFYFLNLKNNASGQWCPYEGGFETGDIDSAAGGIFNGPPMPNGGSADQYLYIGDYGWHRLGIRVHQEAKIEGSSVVYTVQTSFYIDGELVSQYYTDLISASYTDLLYTAKISGGKLVYSDIAENKNMLYYKLREVMSSKEFYIVTADEYATAVTVGEHANPADGFVLDVEKVTSPAYEAFEADGNITLDGTRHFKLKGDTVDVSVTEGAADEKVLLISVDGLRPDAIAETEYYEILKSMGSYTLSAQTVYPSKTMPAHMSMFHSVTPNMHGMSSGNVYAPAGDLGYGITETLAEQGYTMAMFFDWENMQYLTSVPNSVERNYIQWYKNGSEKQHEISTVQLTNAFLEHIENDPTDFTYLYFGMTDQMGHEFNWLSDEYFYAIEHIFTNILRILEALPEDYTVIITSDHGGGGNLGKNNHGSSAAVDMTTPVFIIGDGFEAGATLGNEVSILDIAPTVIDVLGAEAYDCWIGKSLAADGESKRESAAKSLFLSEDAWDNYKYGGISSTVATDESITMKLYGKSSGDSKGISSLQLTRYAVCEMMSLGFRYLSFTVTLAADGSSKTPTYVDLYTYEDATEDKFLTSTCDSKDPENLEYYYASGREITIDLWGLYSCLTDSDGWGLMFVLSAGLYWQATNGGKITLSNVKLERDPDPYAPEEAKAGHVLLVSVDGLRPDALGATEYFEMLKAMGAYTLSAQTINPSMTLPAHMSMFHSVTPTTHGVTSNTYAPSGSLGNGITETLSEAGLTAAMFYDWRELQDLSQASAVEKNYVKPDTYYEASVKTLCDMAIDHIQNSPTDFTFLYFGHTDCVGEGFGFTSSTYMAAVRHVFENLFNVLEALPDDYTVIITADHGGGGYNGNNAHGSTSPVDMFIPMIIIGDGFDAGASLDGDISILDVAPTIADLLGVDAESYWAGHSLANGSEPISKDAALDLFLSEDAWDNYNYGTITGTTEGEDSITMQLSGSGMTGLQLKKSAIGEMISLGYRYLSFTVTYEKVSGGNTPTYADVYTYNYNTDYNFHVSDNYNESPQDPGECYYASGSEVTVDLWMLYARLTSSHGLIFVLSAGLYWKATNGGYITFSDVDVKREIDTEEPTAEEKALDVFFNIGTWGEYSSHGKVNSINNDGSSLTVGVTKNSSTNFAGMQLNKTAVGKMLDLGFTSLSFKMEYEAGAAGITPGYACVYYHNSELGKQVDLDFLGKSGRDDYYYRDGDTIVIDLEGLYDALLSGDGLVFILTKKADWISSGSSATTTKNGYFIFSNIKFS